MSQFAQQAVNIGAQGTSTIVAPIAGKAIAGAVGMSAGLATALVGGGIAVAAMAVTMWIQRNSLRAEQRNRTTAFVNELEPLLKQNVDAYLQGPRTPESQRVALHAFDEAWAWLTSPQACGNPQMGIAGQNCISERSRTGRPQWDVCKNTPQGCPNWFELYRDPIEAAAPVTGPSSSASADQLLSALTAGSVEGTSLYVGIGLLALAVVFS